MNTKKIEILEENFKLYWSGKQPYISDQRFDELLEELKQENPDHPLITQLGLTTMRGKKYVHKNPMLSLDKVYSFEDLKKWIVKTQRTSSENYVIQYKFDGLAGKLINGVLATRGDGQTGEDISRHKSHIDLVQGDEKKSLVKIGKEKKEILGEIVIPLKTFDRLKVSEYGTFAHPRNLVTGFIGRKETWPKEIHLDFVEYSSSKKEVINARNFTKERWEIVVNDFRKSAIYPTDGLVVKLEDEKYSKSLGCTAHHPLGQIAFKFSGETASREIKEIKWQNGKNSITPVAIIEKATIKNVVINKVTLHNAGFIKGMNLAEGDIITIERAGDVIPHIVALDKKGENNCKIPKECPYCKHPIAWRGPEIYCTNKNCPATKLERLRCALRYFEIDGLGDTTINYLFCNNVITSPEQIFELSFDDLIIIPGFATQSTQNLLDAIKEAKKKITYPIILATLNTEGVGKVTYKKILQYISFEDLVNCKGELLNIPGISERRAISIRESIEKNIGYIEKLAAMACPKEEVCSNKKRICFTGKMEKPRKYYENLAIEHNYDISDKVDKELDVLVTTEINRTSSKMTLAKKYDIKIIELNKWMEEL